MELSPLAALVVEEPSAVLLEPPPLPQAAMLAVSRPASRTVKIRFASYVTFKELLSSPAGVISKIILGKFRDGVVNKIVDSPGNGC